jgi:hypothetical protein
LKAAHWAGSVARMVGMHDSEKQLLAILKARLARVERGEAWGPDRSGPNTADERTQEVARIQARIAELDKGHA